MCFLKMQSPAKLKVMSPEERSAMSGFVALVGLG